MHNGSFALCGCHIAPRARAMAGQLATTAQKAVVVTSLVFTGAPRLHRRGEAV